MQYWFLYIVRGHKITEIRKKERKRLYTSAYYLIHLGLIRHLTRAEDLGKQMKAFAKFQTLAT
jgi:hypothetical protein